MPFASPSEGSFALAAEVSSGALRVAASADLTDFFFDRPYAITSTEPVDQGSFPTVVKILDEVERTVLNFFTGERISVSSLIGSMIKLTPMGDYPSASFFFGQRLILASSLNNPEKIWFSRLGSYRDFFESPVLNDAVPYSFTLASTNFARAKALSGLRELLVFTGFSEWSLGADTSATGVTPSPQTRYGIGDLPPTQVENSVLFVEGKNTPRDYGYDFNTGGYRGNDLSIFASHLFDGREITSTAFAKDPDPILWVTLDNGKVLSMTYFKEQNISAWAQHDFGGEVKQVEVLQRPGNSEVYFIIKRRAGTFLERLANIDRNDENQFKFADSHRYLDLRNKDSSRRLSIKTRTTDATAWTSRDKKMFIEIEEINDGQAFTLDRDRQFVFAFIIAGSGFRGSLRVAPAGELDVADIWILPASSGTNPLTEWLEDLTNIYVDGTRYSLGPAERPVTRNSPEELRRKILNFPVDDYEAGATLKLTLDSSSEPRFPSGAEFPEVFTFPNIRIGDTPLEVLNTADATRRYPIRSNIDIPEELRNAVTSTWTELRDRVEGLERFNDMPVSVYADGSVISSPHVSTTDPLTVREGNLKLGGFYSVICVGLPFVSDIKTLPIDVRGENTVVDENMIVNKIALYLHNTRGLFIGSKEPASETSTADLDSLKTNFDDQLAITPENGIISKVINGSWSREGDVFIRQVDPLPFNIQGIVLTGELAGFQGSSDGGS